MLEDLFRVKKDYGALRSVKVTDTKLNSPIIRMDTVMSLSTELEGDIKLHFTLCFQDGRYTDFELEEEIPYTLRTREGLEIAHNLFVLIEATEKHLQSTKE